MHIQSIAISCRVDARLFNYHLVGSTGINNFLWSTGYPFLLRNQRVVCPRIKISKSIESDILNDGSIDYPDSILSTFDLIIASVHSNLKMSEEKAMARLLKAIENPFTTIAVIDRK